MKNKSNRFQGISRIQSQNICGWYVCVCWRGDSSRRFFHDSWYGGWEAALKAAVAYRDILFQKFVRLGNSIYAETLMDSGNNDEIMIIADGEQPMQDGFHHPANNQLDAVRKTITRYLGTR